MTSKQQIGLGQATSVKLPPISGSGFQHSTQTSLTGTSSMVAQSQANAQQLIYRSIPPNYEADFAFTSDMLGSGLPPRPGGMKGKPGPFSGNTTASEFAKRFKAKPTTQPRVIEFNARTVNSESKRRGVNGFFPPVKLRGSAKTAPPQDSEVAWEVTPEDCLLVRGMTWRTAVANMVPLLRNESRNSARFSFASGMTVARGVGPINRIDNGRHDTNGQQTPSYIDPDYMTYEQYLDELVRCASQMSVSFFSLVDEEENRHVQSHSYSIGTGHVQPQSCPIGTGQRPYSSTYQNMPVTHWRTRSRLSDTRDMKHNDASSTVTMTPTSRISSRMQLMPTSYSEVRPRSSRSVSSSRKSNNSQRQTPDSVRTAPHATDNYSMYPNVFQETFDCDDLSLLPPPKRILPKRDLPWVFRYKVKKNMNELAKIMASKPQQMVDV